MQKENLQEAEIKWRDVSEEFRTAITERGDKWYEFNVLLRSLRAEPALRVEIDLSGEKIKDNFQSIADTLKAFLENKPSGQKREAVIVGTEEQFGLVDPMKSMSWAPNAFSSGVKKKLK